MKARDPQPVAKVKGMRILPLRAGVEAEGIAAGLSGQRNEPLQHRLAVAARTSGGIRDQVIDVECLPARQHVLYSETRDRNNGVVVFKKRQLISLGLLSLDASEKLVG